MSSTRRGARLARLLAGGRLHAWEVSPNVTERAEQVVAELAANAALHGRVQGRDFRVALTLDSTSGILRIAVTDARGDRPLPTDTLPAPHPPHARDTQVEESGRGLLLVSALADRWGTELHPPAGKTVWAELDDRPTARPRPINSPTALRAHSRNTGAPSFGSH
ncbi:ATP-binding protein [Streptomyces sp. NPDC127049]|uniref:ATP-binding protein n=1 Tax=Streptomyces sp. NPDC127049 TaxID=3347118 RepID=UPI00365C638D